MLSDNGPPFGSRGLGGLSRLSVWLIKLGVQPVFIEPGHSEQNGKHERFHETLIRECLPPRPEV
jgi:putative transposase